MTRLPLTKDEGWVLGASASCDFQNDSDDVIRYALVTSTPATEEIGFSLPPNEVRGVELTGGLQLWFRADRANLANVEIALWA